MTVSHKRTYHCILFFTMYEIKPLNEIKEEKTTCKNKQKRSSIENTSSWIYTTFESHVFDLMFSMNTHVLTNVETGPSETDDTSIHSINYFSEHSPTDSSHTDHLHQFLTFDSEPTPGYVRIFFSIVNDSQETRGPNRYDESSYSFVLETSSNTSCRFFVSVVPV